MGAKIDIRGNTAIISGVDGLTGADVVATDLRAGAALVISGLAAGDSTISIISAISAGDMKTWRKN